MLCSSFVVLSVERVRRYMYVYIYAHTLLFLCTVFWPEFIIFGNFQMHDFLTQTSLQESHGKPLYSVNFNPFYAEGEGANERFMLASAGSNEV